MLHIVIVLNVNQLSAMLPGQAGSFKNQKNAFLNDPKSQKKRFLAIFWSLVCWIDLILHIMKALYALQHLSALIHKSQRCIFEYKEPKKEVFGHFLDFGLLDRLDIA